MDNQMRDEDIFYSDDEFSDSEDFYQVPDYNNSKAGGSIFYQHGGSSLIEKQRSNTIDRPVNQISMGMAGMGLGGNFLNHDRPTIKTQSAPKSLSYSSMAKKEPLQPIKPNIIKPKIPPLAVHRAEPKKPTTPSMRVAETALMAGYRFRASNPEHDPRYPADQQMMVGPIPGHLDHDTIYNSLRSIFQAKGPVCFMFLHKSAVKDNITGKPVKFGYVVFAEQGVAQKVLKAGTIAFNGGIKIKVSPML
jgi:hypothetical protein